MATVRAGRTEAQWWTLTSCVRGEGQLRAESGREGSCLVCRCVAHEALRSLKTVEPLTALVPVLFEGPRLAAPRGTGMGAVAVGSGSPLAVTVPPVDIWKGREMLWVSTTGDRSRGLQLASRGLRPLVQRGGTPQERIIQPQVSIMLRLDKPALAAGSFSHHPACGFMGDAGQWRGSNCAGWQL